MSSAVASRYLSLPLTRLLQQCPSERRFMRPMSGLDAVRLIEAARKLHRQALADKKVDR